MIFEGYELCKKIEVYKHLYGYLSGASLSAGKDHFHSCFVPGSVHFAHE